MNPRAGVKRKRTPWLRWVVTVAALLAVAVPLLASRMRQDPPMVTVPDEGGAYVEAAIRNPDYLNPILLQYNQVDRDICALIFNGLTRLDENGLIVPDLAERWEIGDEGKSYLFHLRNNVRWHDRTPFTADDVVFTIKAIQDPDFQGSQEVGDLWRNVAVEQLDEFTVKFTLKEAFAPFLEYTTVGIIPKHLYADYLGEAIVSSPHNYRPIGTGPFKLAKGDGTKPEASISSEGIILERYTDYHGPLPNLAQLRFRFYPDYASALAALEKGEVDGLPYLDIKDVSRLENSEKLTIYSAPDYLRYAILFLNNNTPLFKDKSVRQAIAHAIDKDRIVQVILEGQGLPGKGPISPASWAFDPKVKEYEYDPKKAESLLESAGWIDSNGDGVREKDGADLSFVILTNDNQRRIKAGELLAEDLRKIGFKTEVQATGWTDLLREYLASRTFVGAIAEQWLLTVDPDVYSLWHSSQAGNGGYNLSGLSNERVDRILEEARRTVDRTHRAQLYSEFQEIWAEECPSVLLYYPEFNWAVSRNIKGINLTTMIDGSSRFRHVNQWYVKTKQVPATQAP